MKHPVFSCVKPEHKDTVLKKRYVPITIVCGLLALLALGGQFAPAPSEELSVRLRLDNKGGDVVFTHSRHVQYVEKDGGNCAKCHHESENPGLTPLPCGSCHATEFNAKFSADHQTALPEETCTRCHHAELGKLTYSHDDHADQYASSCTDCHHDTDIEAEPGACNQCHGEKADGDTPALREILKDYLESKGYVCDCAATGSEGLALLGEQEYDLVLTDLRLPGADGFEILQATNELQNQIPKIIMTGGGDIKDALHAMHLGAYDFLQKPLRSLDELGVVINRALDHLNLIRLEREHLAEIERMNEKLETEVAERTRELVSANKRLVTEIEERKLVQASLRQKEEELSRQSLNLHKLRYYERRPQASL